MNYSESTRKNTGALQQLLPGGVAWNKDALPAEPPIASATSEITGLTVVFTDTSTNDPYAWDYDFGDGTAHSTEQNPTHVYAVGGTYSVVVRAYNKYGYTETTVSVVLSTEDPPILISHWSADNTLADDVGGHTALTEDVLYETVGGNTYFREGVEYRYGTPIAWHNNIFPFVQENLDNDKFTLEFDMMFFAVENYGGNMATLLRRNNWSFLGYQYGGEYGTIQPSYFAFAQNEYFGNAQVYYPTGISIGELHRYKITHNAGRNELYIDGILRVPASYKNNPCIAGSDNFTCANNFTGCDLLKRDISLWVGIA